jgi:hypothetical protein
MRKFANNSMFSDRDLNPGPVEYEPGVLTLATAFGDRDTYAKPSSLKILLLIIPNLYLDLRSDIFYLSFRNKIVYEFFVSQECYTPPLCHTSLFDYPNNIWRKVQIMKLLIIFPPTFRYFLSPRSEYSLLNPIPEHLTR